MREWVKWFELGCGEGVWVWEGVNKGGVMQEK